MKLQQDIKSPNLILNSGKVVDDLGPASSQEPTGLLIPSPPPRGAEEKIRITTERKFMRSEKKNTRKSLTKYCYRQNRLGALNLIWNVKLLT